jgi:DNA invertase Pin-like site-specific DNA recombinase
MPPKAISYIRFSSSIQKFGDSLRRQNKLINTWLAANPDIILADIKYQDLGLSGYKGDHLDHGFGQLLAAIENNYINAGDYLLVEDIDRLGRMEAADMMTLLMGILKSGVIIETLGDGQSYTRASMNSSQLYILVGKIQQAFDKSNTLSKRIKESWDNKRKKAEDGLGVNRKSFWYITKDKDEKYTKVTSKDKSLVNKIFTMFLTGVSQNNIVAFLKEYDPIRFKTYSPTALKKMLVNKTAIGYWGDMANVYEPAIDEDLFYSVQNKIKSDSGTRQGAKSNHIMSGLVECKRCGKNYAIRNQKHSASVMYCSNANKGNCDNKAVIPLTVLNEFRMQTQIGFINKIINSQVNKDNQKSVVALDGKIDTLYKSIDNLVVLVANGSSGGINKTLKLEAELKELEIERAGLVQTKTSTVNIENLKMAGLDMANDPSKFNNMLKMVGFKIIADNKTMSIGEDQMEYIKHLQGSKKKPSGYEVSIFGNKEVIPKSASTSLSQDEQVNALIKQSKSKATPLSA